MKLDPRDHTGLMLIRAWTEPGGRPALRVRITSTLGLDAAEAVTTATTVGQVVAAVRGWLEALLAAQS